MTTENKPNIGWVQDQRDIEARERLTQGAPGAITGSPNTDSHEFIVTTNREHAEWFRAMFVPECEIDLKSLWAWQEQERRKRAALASLPAGDGLTVPDGWKLVPVTPTADQLYELMSDGEKDAAIGMTPEHRALLIERAGISERYEAMLEAAPQHQTAFLAAPRQPGEMGVAPAPAIVDLEGLRSRLLAPREIVRDAEGWLTHPAYPATDEDVRADKLLEAFGIDTRFVSMEYDDPDAYDCYFEAESPDCSGWNPTPPDGDGWRLLEIYDTEDGPWAMFARELPAPKRQRTVASAQQDEREAGDTYLCQAWGETDLPATAIVTGMDDVRAFLIEQWLGSADETDDDGVNLLDRALKDMREQWALEGEAWKWECTLEIGGVSVQKVADFSPAQASAAHQVQAEAGAKPFAWFRRRSDGYLEGPIFDGDERICDTRRTFWTPLYTHPSPEGESDKTDAGRWRTVTRFISAWLSGGRRQVWSLESLPIPAGVNLMRGSVAEHFTNAVDAMSREQSKEDGK